MKEDKAGLKNIKGDNSQEIFFLARNSGYILWFDSHF